MLATLRVAHRFLTLTNTKTRTVFAQFGFVIVLVIPDGITHHFVVLTNEKLEAFSPFGLLMVEMQGYVLNSFPHVII